MNSIFFTECERGFNVVNCSNNHNNRPLLVDECNQALSEHSVAQEAIELEQKQIEIVMKYRIDLETNTFEYHVEWDNGTTSWIIAKECHMYQQKKNKLEKKEQTIKKKKM